MTCTLPVGAMYRPYEHMQHFFNAELVNSGNVTAFLAFAHANTWYTFQINLNCSAHDVVYHALQNCSQLLLASDGIFKERAQLHRVALPKRL